MNTRERLAELESLGRPLTADECREANFLRRRARDNDSKRLRYWTDPDFRQRNRARALASWRRRNPRMEAAE